MELTVCLRALKSRRTSRNERKGFVVTLDTIGDNYSNCFTALFSATLSKLKNGSHIYRLEPITIAEFLYVLRLRKTALMVSRERRTQPENFNPLSGWAGFFRF